MADLIDRQVAIRLLRGECVAKYPNTFAVGLFAAADEINKLPTVDAVEVVRCKKCKLWKRIRDHRGVCKHPTFTFEDDAIDPLTEANDFCSYGERRGDDGDA